MAIDDNTLYGLTGAQIKDLPGKITSGVEAKVKTSAGAPTTSTVGTVGQLIEDTTNGKLYICTAVDTEVTPAVYTWSKVGGESYTTLTSADYNYPADNPTSIALWLLPVGMYKVGEAGMTMRANTTVPLNTNAVGMMIFIADGGDNRRAIMYSSKYNYVPLSITSVSTSDGRRLDDGYGGQILTQYLVKNNLTTSSGSSGVLDAYQGYVLNNKITTLDDKVDTTIINGGTTAPTTSTEGSVGTLYSYMDAGSSKLYQCTAVNTGVTPAVYTWSEVGGNNGAGTRRATASGWDTSSLLNYVLAQESQSGAQGGMFYAGDNLSDFPVYVGIGVDADNTTDDPYMLVAETTDDGTGTLSSVRSVALAKKSYVDGLVGNIESALQAINNGGNA